MSLTYLTGDEIGKSKKKSSGGGGGAKKQARQTKRTTKKAARKSPEKKAAKKEKRKRVFKKVAKVAVAPARAAFLTAVSLNLVKLATKLVRVWNKPGGKAQLTKFWAGFGGNIDVLKKAIIKGSKQQISGESIGVVAATVLATATPIVVALVPIIKAFKASGDGKEAQEFNDGVHDAKKDLAENEDVPKSTVSMPSNKDAGIVTDKSGDAQEDEKETRAARKESETGGNDSDDGEDEKKKLKSGATSDANKSEDGGGESSEDKAKKAMASNFSPLGLFFMTLMYLSLYKPSGIIFELIATYCLIGIILIPLAIQTRKNIVQKIAYKISYTPINLINKFNQIIKTKWAYLTN